jgi:general secretion pathway protein J
LTRPSTGSARRGAAGLTLIEVMVSIGVLSMVGITIWSATSQSARVRNIVLDAHERYHEVRTAFDFMTRDIQSAFLSQHRAPVEPTHDTIFIGEDQGSEDRLDFAAFSHQRRYFDSKESDQCEVGYFLERDPEESDQMNLIRRTSPILDLEPLEGGQYLILVRDVLELDLQYFDLSMEEWQDSWDTTELTGETGHLPSQIRIRLKVRSRRGDEIAYGTQFGVPMRTPIWRQEFIPGPPVVVNK